MQVHLAAYWPNNMYMNLIHTVLSPDDNGLHKESMARFFFDWHVYNYNLKSQNT